MNYQRFLRMVVAAATISVAAGANATDYDKLPLPKLIELSRDEKGWIRCQATVALGKRCSHEAVPALIERTTDSYYRGGGKCGPPPDWPVSRAAREGLYRCTGLALGGFSRRSPDEVWKKVASDWWEQHKNGRRLDWLLSAFSRDWPRAASYRPFQPGYYGVSLRRKKGEPVHPLATEIVAILSSEDAEKLLEANEPEKQYLGLLYACQHLEQFPKTADLEAVAARLLRLHLRAPVPDLAKYRREPFSAGELFKALLSDLERTVLSPAAEKVLLSLAVRTEDDSWVIPALAPFLPLGQSSFYGKLAAKHGTTWESLYVKLALRAWKGGDYRPSETDELHPLHKAAVLVSLIQRDQEWDPRILAMLEGTDAAEKHAICRAFEEMPQMLEHRKSIPAAAVAAAQAGLADADPVVQKTCTAIVAKQATIERLLAMAESRDLQAADTAIKALRRRFWGELREHETAKVLVAAIIPRCRSKDPEVRVRGFEWYASLPYAAQKGFYDPELFVPGLQDPESEIRRHCCHTVSRCGSGADKQKLLTLIIDEDPAVRQAFLNTVDRNTPPEALKQLAPYLAELDADSQDILAQRLLSVVDEDLARAALRILLTEAEPAKGKPGRRRPSLLALVRKFPRLPSEEEVVLLAVHANSCLNGYPVWKGVLTKLKGSQFVKPALRALASPNIGGALKEHLRRYFARCGPEEWAAVAGSWSKFRAEDQKTLIDLLREKQEFRQWLVQAAKAPGNDGIIRMAEAYNGGRVGGEPAIPVEGGAR